MKVLLSLALGIGLQTVAHASVVEVKREQKVSKNPTELYQVLTAYDETCDTGCKYRVKGLQESKLIENLGDEQFIWQRLSGVSETRQFIHNQVFYGDKGQISFVSEYPSTDKIAELSSKAGEVQKSIFRTLTLKWIFTPQDDGTTLASVTMRVDHSLPEVASPIIRNALEQSTLDLFKNFSI